MKKFLAAGLALLFLVGCSYSAIQENPSGEQSEFKAVKLKDLGPAPELHNEIWLNTDEPLRLADLRGKVVLLDMWTFG